MVVETSAVLAILLEEPEAAEFAQLVEDDPAPVISAPRRRIENDHTQSFEQGECEA